MKPKYQILHSPMTNSYYLCKTSGKVNAKGIGQAEVGYQRVKDAMEEAQNLIDQYQNIGGGR